MNEKERGAPSAYYFLWGRGPTFALSRKLAKSQSLIFRGGFSNIYSSVQDWQNPTVYRRGGGGLVFQLLYSVQNRKVPYYFWGEGLIFRLLLVSWKLAKSPNPIFWLGGPIFVLEAEIDKIPNFWWGGMQGGKMSFPIFVPESKLTKCQSAIFSWGGVVNEFLNFCSWVQNIYATYSCSGQDFLVPLVELVETINMVCTDNLNLVTKITAMQGTIIFSNCADTF